MSLEAATKKLKEAEAELSQAQEILQAFVSENFRSTAAGLVYITNHSRDALDDDLRALVNKADAARAKFHHALAVWSQLK